MDIEQAFTRDFVPIADLIGAHAAQQPRHAALIQGERALGYASLDALMDRVAAGLQRDGIGPREAIAICAANSIEYAALFLGALRAGVAVAPLAPSSAAESIKSMVADCGAKRLFTLEDREFQDWLAPVGAKPERVAIQPDWPFNIIYSSGTTGVPKGIVQSHRMRWGHVRRGKTYGYGLRAVTLLSTPLYSNTTLVSFFPTLALGGTVVLMAKFDVAQYLALAEKHRVTHTMLVPVQYRRIMAHPDFDNYDLSSFRMKFSTSAPFPAALKAEVLRRWPGGLIEVYGMTEGGGTCILVAHEHPDKLHTVGRPAEGHDIRLIDEHGREVALGEAGEVVGHSPLMMTGYHNQPQKTAEAEWHDTAGKRFIRTGDVGRFDADGFLTLLDRKKDMIISGGFNIYPSDLEAVLGAHPDVAEVAVIGVASERWGETPVAFVVPKPGSTPRAEELLAWANARLGKTQRLADLRLADELPRSAIGKVLKRTLRDAYRPAADSG
jgi:acyl-CoA synthetase (AMP-forming)/AMP-acid ligase II